MVPLSAFTRYDPSTAPLAVNHSGAVPVRHDLVQPACRSGARAPRWTPINGAETEIRLPATIRDASRARRRLSRRRSPTSPSSIAAALVTVYIVLGVLYESYIHPITILSTLPSAGVGALLALMITAQRSLA